MQALNIEYDLSFFDTDPFEPIPGGVTSIWPFTIGKFIELPYTLVQDSTLVNTLGQETAAIWLEKINFIAKYHGMALVNTHPDYLKDERAFKIYADFLEAVREIDGYWHALPRSVSQWWRARSMAQPEPNTFGASVGKVQLDQGEIKILSQAKV
jgi:hypothetical protein